jgi:hypothetical protein
MLSIRPLTLLLAGLLWVGAGASVLAHESRDSQGARGATAKGNMAHNRPALGLGVAIAPDRSLWIAGVDEQGRLFVQTSADQGASWSSRRLLDTAGDAVAADGESRPKIAFGPHDQVVIAYTKPLAKPYTGEIRLLRSSDGGRSFSTPSTVHQDRQQITHRFESVAFDAQGTLHAVWVDKRDQVAAAKDGDAYRGAAIYRSESRDGGAHFGPDTKLADHSCECCRIALARNATGQVVAMWRHVFAPNVRDHAFAVLDAKAEPMRASYDEWKLDSCPHHGPGLALAADGGFHAVWFGYRGEQGAVRYGRLTAQGKPVGAVRELPDEAAEHADVLADGRFVAVLWRSFDGHQTRLRAWLSRDDGATFELRDLAASADENDHPRLAQGAGVNMVVWRTTRTLYVFPLKP